MGAAKRSEPRWKTRAKSSAGGAEGAATRATARARPGAKEGTSKPSKSREGAAPRTRASKEAAAPSRARTSERAPAQSPSARGKAGGRAERLPPSRAEAREVASPAAARAPSPDEHTRGKYVYCVVRADTPLQFGELGIDVESAEVHSVNFRDIAAVVSDVPMVVPEPTRVNLLAHERVNAAVMREHTVVPMAFGTVFKTREDVQELLRSAYDAFKGVLVKLEDKLELGLKVHWDRDAVVKQLETESEEIRRLKAEISTQKGSTLFARVHYGRLLDRALEAWSERRVEEIFDALRPVSVASRAGRPIGDRMIMNAAFLVSRANVAAFDAVVKAIGATLDTVTLQSTGPWPPYHFVNIRLKLERT